MEIKTGEVAGFWCRRWSPTLGGKMRVMIMVVGFVLGMFVTYESEAVEGYTDMVCMNECIASGRMWWWCERECRY